MAVHFLDNKIEVKGTTIIRSKSSLDVHKISNHILTYDGSPTILQLVPSADVFAGNGNTFKKNN